MEIKGHFYTEKEFKGILYFIYNEILNHDIEEVQDIEELKIRANEMQNAAKNVLTLLNN